MRVFRCIILVVSFVLLAGGSALSQEFVWKPTNTAFGGNPTNYQWLIQSAEAQNKLTEPREDDRFVRDPLQDFEASFQRQLLNQLSRELMQDMFGEVGLEEGRYGMGDFIIEVTPGAEGLEVHIFDISTGGETNIIVPYF